MRSWRWAVVAVLVGVLASVPGLAGALLPTGESDLTAEQLRDLVRASDRVVWEGLGESRADLPIPDVPDLDAVPALLGGTTRTRTTWLSPERWRVDRLDVAGEVSTIQDVVGETDLPVDPRFAAEPLTTTWTSADRTVDYLFGELPVRLPRAADLSAPVLGRRLAATPGTTLSRLDERRVAGRTAAGLRLRPADPTRTTVESVDLWVDPDSGLPLRVEVRTPGQRNPVLTSLLLDLDVGRADAGRLDFQAPPGSDDSQADAIDIATEINAFAPYLLPDALAGSPRTDPGRLRSGGVGVYGSGLEAYVVVPVQGGLARRVLDAADPQGAFPTPLVNALVGRDGRRTYLLAGTVPISRLQVALAELRENRPPRLNG